MSSTPFLEYLSSFSRSSTASSRSPPFPSSPSMHSHAAAAHLPAAVSAAAAAHHNPFAAAVNGLSPADIVSSAYSSLGNSLSLAEHQAAYLQGLASAQGFPGFSGLPTPGIQARSPSPPMMGGYHHGSSEYGSRQHSPRGHSPGVEDYKPQTRDR